MIYLAAFLYVSGAIMELIAMSALVAAAPNGWGREIGLRDIRWPVVVVAAILWPITAFIFVLWLLFVANERRP